MANNLEAVYDTLFIGLKLQRKMEDFSQYEVQFFAYFSCLLSLYDGNPLDGWNYSFVKTDFGSPYSSDVQNALVSLTAHDSLKESRNSIGYYPVLDKGTVEESLSYYTVTDKGTQLSKFLESNTNMFRARTKYLNTACNSLSLIPYGTIKEAINNEPVLNSAGNSLSKRSLLLETNPATKVLYAQFKALKDALEEKHYELMVPAVIWLESLKNEANLLQQV